MIIPTQKRLTKILPYRIDEPENKASVPAEGAADKTSSSTLPTQPQQSGAGAGTGDTTAGQNDVRDPANPRTDPKSAPTDVDDTGDGPNPAQKLDGPGPKPLEELARERGGDAGGSGSSLTSPAASTTNASGAGAGAGDKSSSASLGQTSKASGAGESEDEPNAESKGEGTGEKYVKSSGLKADGGDFDVTKPGAGREADRKSPPPFLLAPLRLSFFFFFRLPCFLNFLSTPPFIKHTD